VPVTAVNPTPQQPQMPQQQHVPHQHMHLGDQQQQRGSVPPDDMNGDRSVHGSFAGMHLHDGIRKEAQVQQQVPIRANTNTNMYVNGKAMYATDDQDGRTGADRQALSQSNGVLYGSQSSVKMNGGSEQAYSSSGQMDTKSHMYGSEGTRRTSVGVMIPGADKTMMANRDLKVSSGGIQQTAQDWKVAGRRTFNEGDLKDGEAQDENDNQKQRRGSVDMQQRGWQNAEIRDLDDLSAMLMREASALTMRLQKVCMRQCLCLCLSVCVCVESLMT
jgi:hypothetical protein